MDIILFTIIFHAILYSPYMLQNRFISGHPSYTEIDTVSTTGVPFYFMGKFVRYMEI